MIHLLDDRLHRGLKVFEYGSGGSTTFFAGRAGTVVSVEHDRRWIDELAPSLDSNVTMLHRPLDENGLYAGSIEDAGAEFDVILVDGRDRLHCLRHAIETVSQTGVIIVDDTERARYDRAATEAEATGFRRLDLVGLRPGGVRNTITTLLYRSENCLGI
jgi:tRNA A58 N-methylase Trm61